MMSENGSTNGTLIKNRPAMDRFLGALRNSGNIRAACGKAGVPRSTAYAWRNKWVTFKAEWDEAKEDACDILEGEAWKRATKGKSDGLLIFLLKAHRSSVYVPVQRSEVKAEHSGEVKTGDGLSDEERIARTLAIYDAARARRARQSDN